MTQNQRRLIFLFTGLFAILLTCLLAWMWRHHRSADQVVYNEVLMQSAQDQRVLHNLAHSSDHDIYLALVRSAKRGQPIAFSSAQTLLSSPSLIIRRGAIEALGFADPLQPWMLDAYDQALKSPEPALRQEALASLGTPAGTQGTKSAPERDSKLKAFLKDKTSSPQDKIVGLNSLYAVATQPAEKHFALNSLIALAEGSAPAEIRKSALNQALFLAPHDAQVISFIKHTIAAASFPEAWSTIFRHLTISDKTLANQLFEKLAANGKLETRLAALKLIPQFCPESRWEILLTEYKNETEDAASGTILSTILSMPGDSAEEALLRLSGDMKLGERKRKLAQQTLAKLRQPRVSQQDPCAYAAGDLHPPGFIEPKATHSPK